METISRNLDALAAFHAVAVETNFGRAAETVGSSKAMMSKLIKRLEASLGAQLFHRTTRKVALTEEGATLFDYSKKIFSLSSEAGKRMQDLSQGESGLIRLAAPVSLGEIFVPAILSGLTKALPEVRFEIDLSNDKRDFEKDQIDFAIRAIEEHSPNQIVRDLGRIRDVVVASPSFLEKAKLTPTNFIDPRALAQLNCIMNSHQSAWNLWAFQKGAQDISVEVRGQHATNQYPMARILCLNGFGIAKLPLYLVEQDLADSQLVRLLPEFTISTHPLYLVYLRGDYASRKKKITKEAILAWFKDNNNLFVLRQ